MAKSFSIRDFMDNDVRQQDSDVYEKVSIHDIGLNPKNEYVISEIEKLKDSIYALGGVQQNVVLARCPEWSAHRYLALDGHRRVMACRQLVGEGCPEFEYVPAVIKTNLDTDVEDAMLVMINSTQRNKSDWERVMEHMKLKEIIPRVKKRQGLDGRTRDIEADMLGVSRGQVSIYNVIGTRLIADLMRLFKGGTIGISLAYTAAQLEPVLQRELVRLAAENGSFDEKDIKMLVDRSPIKGQVTIGSESTGSIPPGDGENVPESGTSERILQEPGNTLTGEDKNVPESGTSERILQDQDNPPPESTEVCHIIGTNGKKQAAVLRGGYGIEMVEQQIRKYGGYLEILVEEGGTPCNLVNEYKCLLDALELLREKLTTGENDI